VAVLKRAMLRNWRLDCRGHRRGDGLFCRQISRSLLVKTAARPADARLNRAALVAVAIAAWSVAGPPRREAGFR